MSDSMYLDYIRDVTQITFLKFRDLPQNVIDALNIGANRIGGISTVDQLQHRMVECVHWHTLCMTPVSSSFLNRLFSRVAIRLEVQPTLIVQDLILKGTITSVEFFRKTGLVATAPWDEAVMEMATYAAQTIKGEQERSEYLENAKFLWANKLK